MTLFSGTGGESSTGIADRANNKLVVPPGDWFLLSLFAGLTAAASLRDTSDGAAIDGLSFRFLPVPEVAAVSLAVPLTTGEDLQLEAVANDGNIHISQPRLSIFS